MTAVGIIPARGGSKRIPRKNIRDFHGQPLISRTIRTLLDSAIFDDVVVSTDDDEIAEVSQGAGASVPFRRPAELADDMSGTGAVVRHAIGMIEQSRDAQGEASVDHVCLVYPGAVFVTPGDLVESFDTLTSNEVQYVYSATSFASSIDRAVVLDERGLATMRHPEHLLTRSQDLTEAFHDVGQFYWGRIDAWKQGVAVLTGRSMLHLLPRWRVQDIDTPEDWERAEVLYEVLQRTGR